MTAGRCHYRRATLGGELKRARDEAGLSQEEVAHRAKIDRGYLSRLENGHKSPALDLLFRVCDAIGVKAATVAERKRPEKT